VLFRSCSRLKDGIIVGHYHVQNEATTTFCATCRSKNTVCLGL
jgi:hypothetical protein